MTFDRRVEAGLWTAAVVLAALAAARAAPLVEVEPPGSRTPRRPVVTVPAESAAAWSRVIGARDPFRLERRPADVRYGAAPRIEAMVQRPPRPALVLQGILGGPPWRAVVEGLPGRTGGTVLAEGDSVGPLAVRLVTRDSIVIAGMDTTWVLRIRETWR